MTAKQKANQARFKKVVAEAKKLRTKNPKLTQAQAVKQAWAISYSKKDISVGANPMDKGRKVEIRPASAKSKKFIVWDIKSNQIFANEKFNSYQDAIDFVNQNKMIISGGNVPISKYNVGDEVFSYQNKTYKAPIAYIKFVPWEGLSKPNSKDKYVYKLKLKDGYSNYINEESLSKKSIGGMPTKVKANKGKRTSEMHTDTKSHNVNIRVMSGVKRKRSIGDLPTYKDKDAAREIELYADNDSQLYFQMKRPILINLGNKYKKGTYSIEKAAKLWRYFIDAALKKYNKEFGSRGDKWFELLNTHDRQLLALEYAQATKDEFDLGNFTN
jgi:hypothetical protein